MIFPFFQLLLNLGAFAVTLGPINTIPCDIDDKMCSEDARLVQEISISATRIRLGELLDRISTKTGVQLTADDRDPSSGIFVSTQINKTRLSTLMNAMGALLSSRDGMCSWRRSSSNGQFVYQLGPSLKTKQRSDKLREYAKRVAVTHALTMVRLAGMSESQRQKHKGEITESLGLEDDRWADGLVSAPGVWKIVRFLAGCLSTQQIASLVKAESEITIRADALSPNQYRLYEGLWDAVGTKVPGPDGALQPARPPETIQLYTKPYDRASATIAPVTYFRCNDKEEVSVLGGYYLEDGIRAAIRKAWILPGETLDSASEHSLADSPISLKTPSVRPPIQLGERTVVFRPQYSMELRLIQTAQGANISLIAVLPRKQDIDPGDPVHLKVGDVLQRLNRSVYRPMHKWSSQVLLVSYPAWFIEDNLSVPYRVVKAYLSRRDGLIPLNELVGLMSEITDNQADDLAQDYPAVKAFLPMRALLTAARRYPSLLSASGVRLSPEAVAELGRQMPRLSQHPAVVAGRPVTLRLVQIDTVTEGRSSIMIRPEILNPDGEWQSLGGFAQILPKQQ